MKSREEVKRYNRKHAAKLGFTITGFLTCFVMFYSLIGGYINIASDKVLDVAIMLSVILGGVCFGRFVFLCKTDA